MPPSDEFVPHFWRIGMANVQAQCSGPYMGGAIESGSIKRILLLGVLLPFGYASLLPQEEPMHAFQIR